MVNRWWTDSASLAGVDSTGEDKNEGDDKENNDEPKDEVTTTRRPRGRPPGSKNKPKPSTFVTKDSPNALQSHVMEIANGVDIADSLIQFAGRRQRCICVLSATGTVTDVTLRQHTVVDSIMSLHGRFEIISLRGSFLLSSSGSTGLTVYLVGGQVKMVGGGVVGPLVVSGPVMIMAVTFSNAAYERLPLPIEDNDQQGQGGGSGGGSGGSPPGTRGGIKQQPGGEGQSFPMYSLALTPLNMPQVKQ